MIKLKPLSSDSWPEQSMDFGLAIQLNNQQFHALVLYRFQALLMLGDLPDHQIVRCRPAEQSQKIYWVNPQLDQGEQQILAAKIHELIIKNIGRIPYSVADSGGIKFENGNWIGNLPGQGLTCATFIVELFNELGIPFIDMESWEVRDGDEEWALNILEALSKKMTADHVTAQKESLKESIRIRPADIFAAGHLICSEMDVPLCFKKVDPLSKSIEHKILEIQ